MSVFDQTNVPGPARVRASKETSDSSPSRVDYKSLDGILRTTSLREELSIKRICSGIAQLTRPIEPTSKQQNLFFGGIHSRSERLAPESNLKGKNVKMFSFELLAIAAALIIVPAASATQIVGSIGVGGGNDVWSTTGISFNNPNAIARDATGGFATILGASPATNPATINNVAFNFTTPDSLIFTVGTGTATFKINGPLNVSLDNSEFLNLSGTGVLTLTGYAPTLATFSLTSTDSSSNMGQTGSSTYGFDVVATPTTPTPEPSSLFLLGSGLLGFAGMFRRSQAK